MCLAVPMKLVERAEELGVVELDGVRREVSLLLQPEARLGDFVLVHAGYAIGMRGRGGGGGDARPCCGRWRCWKGPPVSLTGSATRRRCAALVARIGRLAEDLPRRVTFMEVCGTHTHAIAAAGLRRLLPPRCA